MTLPINLRQGDDDAGGNRFAPARFPVPPRSTIRASASPRSACSCASWRAEPALQMTSTLAGILNRLPTATTTALFGGMLKCCDFVDVERARRAGSRVRRAAHASTGCTRSRRPRARRSTSR